MLCAFLNGNITHSNNAFAQSLHNIVFINDPKMIGEQSSKY